MGIQDCVEPIRRNSGILLALLQAWLRLKDLSLFEFILSGFGEFWA